MSDQALRRSNSRSTAIRINSDCGSFGPKADLMRSSVPSGKRAVTFSSAPLMRGRPMDRAIDATGMSVEPCILLPPSIDGIVATTYIDATNYRGKPMTYNATDGILDNLAGLPIASRVTLRKGEDSNASMARLALVLNAAQSLIEKIEDTPALFFGMEDTCEDEFAALREGLAALDRAQVKAS